MAQHEGEERATPCGPTENDESSDRKASAIHKMPHHLQQSAHTTAF